MIIEKDLSHIAKAVALANANFNANAVPASFSELYFHWSPVKSEALAQKFVAEHGLLPVSSDEVDEEFTSLDAVENDKEDDDFDSDENLVDMDAVSEEMRGIFE